ncbi:pseudouridine synthase [Annulohypoxylon moriforme]|nr:pseudouridine synthase [Annulohypoxylon moriforme]
MATHTAMAQGSNASIRGSFEQRVGIIHYVSQKEHGWSGDTRTRFTDFQVNEISKDGTVIHLHDLRMSTKDQAKTEPSRQPTAKPQSSPSQPQHGNPTASSDDTPTVNKEGPASISESDRSILIDLLGQTTTEELIDLYSKANENKKSAFKTPIFVKISAITEKSQRSRVHSEIRRIFSSKIDTSTDGDGSIKAALAGRGNQQWGNRHRNERPSRNERYAGQDDDAKFLHFTLYKENRDTIEAINQIARFLNLKPSYFGTAGTKDRRAVTSQRVSIRRRNPQSMISLNSKLYGVKIGDFTFEKNPIHLGQHSGNEFVIVLKNCHFNGTENMTFEQKLDVANTTVTSALEQVNRNGFINYYGTQRFGTHRIGTQEIGMMILKQDFEGAVRALLSFDPDLIDPADTGSLAVTRRDDASRARACWIFSDTGNVQDALKYLPRRCHVESTLIRHLGKQSKDYVGALLSISRGMRTMYVHAYQSLVWNFAASKRWELYGQRVVKGDLVIVESSQNDPQTTQDDEETIHLGDSESVTDDTHGLKAHALTEEEATSGKYSIFDVVLPSPGWDVVYPDNEIAKFYEDFMAMEENGGLDPHNMLRRQKDFSLPGSYRKLMGKFLSATTASVQTYTKDTDQLVPTDLDLIESRKAKEAAERAAARRNMGAQTSAWQSFAKNVEDAEHQELRVKTERRKAEEISVGLEHQAMDTWVQTSVDGSNKRVKVATHTDEIKPDTDNKTSLETRGDEDQDEVQMEDYTANQLEENDGTQSMSEDNRHPATSTTNTIHSQAIADAMTPQVQSEHPTTFSERLNTNATLALDYEKPNDENKDGVDIMKNDGQTAEASTSEPPVAPVIHTESPATTDEKKIAVILRFALNTSQYATIVLRELQGMVPVDEDAVDSS